MAPDKTGFIYPIYINRFRKKYRQLNNINTRAEVI